MNAFYEHAVESASPLAEYDPVFDVPEPKKPRRKPAFETVWGSNGWTHRLPNQTIFTGRHPLGKWAGITPSQLNWQPVVICNRNSIAELLRFYRKDAKC